jgi:hypothetical protein
MSDLFTGWIPHAADAVKLKFSAYTDPGNLPKLPDSFGHEEYDTPIDWGMLGNDKYGDCVIAGGAHEHVLWNRIAGRTVSFTTEGVLADYTAITGLPPNPITGADMKSAAAYRLKTGLQDASGTRHKISAYLELRPGDLREALMAMYLFGAVGVGLRFYHAWFDQFRNHQAWQITSGMVGSLMGHYVPLVALRGNLVAVTWGRFQAVRPSVYTYACQQALAYVSEEALVNRKSPEGFDYDALIEDMHALAGG